MTKIDVSRYPNNANSVFLGKVFGIYKVTRVLRAPATFRQKLSASHYIALLTRTTDNVVVAVPYSSLTYLCRYTYSPSNADVEKLFESAIDAGNVVNHGAKSSGAGFPRPVVQSVSSTDIDASTALDMMTRLVHAAKNDSEVAKVVKSLAGLV